MERRTSLMRRFTVLLMAFAIIAVYSVVPMNQTYAASKAKKPARVASLKAAAKSTSSVKLTWKKAKNAKKYQVYVSTKKNKGFKKVATTTKKTYTVKKYNKKALKAGTKYYFKVRAINGSKKGAFSKVVAKSTKAKAKVKETNPTIGESLSRTLKVDVDMTKYEKGKVVEAWIPVPQSDDFQTIENVSFKADKAAVASINTEKVNGNKMLYLKWDQNTEPADRTAVLSFDATRVDVSRTNLKDDSSAAISSEAKAYINKESQYVNISDAVVKDTAAEIVKGKTGTVEKARAIYDWVIANLERIDNGETLVNAKGESKTFNIFGCGYGDTKQILTDLKEFGRAGGHCTDINSTFVALCRASGIAAREMFGIRMGTEGEVDITGWQHCWAEFYLPGTGWVYADPADVLKALGTAGKSATVEQVAAAKASDTCKEKTEYFWGHVDNNRIVLSRGRDIVFEPAQSWGVCNTHGYPCGQVDGKQIENFVNGSEFKYTITGMPLGSLPVDFNDMTDADKWASYGIEYSDLKLSTDYVLDVRTAENYAAGHIVASTNVSVAAGAITDGDEVSKALDAAYEEAAGARIVIVCNSGNSLAKRAMQYYNSKGKTISKEAGGVTYLIGGAKGINEGSYKNNFGIAFDSIDLENDVIVDLRPEDMYSAGHIVLSKNINVKDDFNDTKKAALDEQLASVPDGQKLVLVCIKGFGLAKKAMAYYQDAGADMTKITYLIGGATGMVGTDYESYLGVTEIASDDFVVDVRTKENYDKGHYKGSYWATVVDNSNMAADLEAAYTAAAGKRIVIVCNTGNSLAKKALVYYKGAGKDMKNITYLIGGAAALTEKGLMVTE